MIYKIINMMSVIDNTTLLSILSLLIASTSLLITLYNWRLRRPKLKFDKVDINNEKSFYFETTPENKKKYDKFSTHIACVYIRIYNMSELPITISKFGLQAPSKEKAFYRSNTAICCDIKIDDDKETEFNEVLMINDYILKLPINLKSFDYVEGYIVFPYIKNFSDDNYKIEITAYTARKRFILKTIIKKVVAFDHHKNSSN